MTAAQLLKVKDYQREYFTLFGEKLIVDIIEMQGVDPVYNKQVIEHAFLECVENAKADINIILDKKVRLHAAGFYKERQAMIKFSKIVIGNKLCVTQAAMLVKRDRSCLYHYAGKR